MGTPIWLIKSDDIRRPIEAKYKPELNKLEKPIRFYAGISLDNKMLKKVEGDAAMGERLWKKSSKSYKVAISEACTLYRVFDNKHRKGWGQLDKSAQAKEQNKLKTSVEQALERHAGYVFKDADKEIRNWLKATKNADRYKSQCVFKIVMGTLGVAGATVGAVGSVSGAVASGGAGAPAAVAAMYGAWKAMRGLTREIHKQAQKIDDVDRKLRENLSELTKSYAEKSKTKVGGRELGAAALDQFFTISTNSIAKCSSQTSQMGNLLNVLKKKTGKFGKQLNVLLDKQQTLDKAVEFYAKLIEKGVLDNPDSKKAGADFKKHADKIKTAAGEAKTKSGKCLFHLKSLMRQVEKMEQRLSVYERMLQELKNKKPGWVKYGVGVIKLSDLAITVATLNVNQGIANMDIEKLVGDIKGLTDEGRAMVEDKLL
ncbi:MAG: hypothetical protein V3S55_10670 [Nitrospiraceae bacterium]